VSDVAIPAVSILDRHPADRADGHDPPYFRDLALDQVVTAVTEPFAEYGLRAIFTQPLATLEAVNYRQDACRALESEPLAAAVEQFTTGMRAVRRHLAQSRQRRYPRQKQASLLAAAREYVSAIDGHADALRTLTPASEAFTRWTAWLADYATGDNYLTMRSDVDAVRRALSDIHYCLLIQPGRIDVARHTGEADYAEQVLATFSRFRQGDVPPVAYRFTDYDMNHVEAAVLDHVTRLFPDEFASLDAFCTDHPRFLDPTVAAFDREVQVYRAWLAYLRPMRLAGLPVCYPTVTTTSHAEHVRGCYDAALATHLVPQGQPLVSNDYQLEGSERILVVTGPNQGGKTTFARTVGQLHHLARLGLPVPAAEAHLTLTDQIFTHFERPENLTDVRGKLEDDLLRIRDILSDTTSRSLVVMNEIFTSTTLRDSRELATRILQRLTDLGALAVCVTFIDELTTLNDATVSMVAAVDAEDVTRRTFRIERRPADGRAYAVALAQVHELSYQRIVDRVGAS
jgi:DNA mismatch repair ATPase MutS